MPLTPTQHEKWKRLVEATTPGPWTGEKPPKDANGWSRGVSICTVYGGEHVYSNYEGGQFPSADARFIAAAREAVPALLEENDTLRSSEAEATARAERAVRDGFDMAIEVAKSVEVVNVWWGPEATPDAGVKVGIDSIIRALDHARATLKEPSDGE